MATRSETAQPELHDFVAHLTHPTMRMRTVVIRETSMDAAAALALRLADAPGWRLRDLMTAEDSRAQFGMV